MPPGINYIQSPAMEIQAMQEYISKALAQAYIQPSKSPASTRFFFVEDKVRGFSPCIDYHGLNQSPSSIVILFF